MNKNINGKVLLKKCPIHDVDYVGICIRCKMDKEDETKFSVENVSSGAANDPHSYTNRIKALENQISQLLIILDEQNQNFLRFKEEVNARFAAVANSHIQISKTVTDIINGGPKF